jgi:hypothetical protein
MRRLDTTLDHALRCRYGDDERDGGGGEHHGGLHVVRVGAADGFDLSGGGDEVRRGAASLPPDCDGGQLYVQN